MVDKINKLTIVSVFFVFTISIGCARLTDSTWRPAKKYTHASEFDAALAAAKDWVVSNKKKETENIIYKYSIIRSNELMMASISEISIKPNGDRFAAMDGEVCIYINNDGGIANTKQCYAP